MYSTSEAPTEYGSESTAPVDHDELADLLGDRLVSREEHVHTEGFVVRPDEVQDVLSTLHEVAGFDHLSCVTAQEYDDRCETIYHLKSFDDPTRELNVVVPTAKLTPVSQTAAPVYQTAE